MKLCAIIAEFDPLTNGHAYIISKAKQLTNEDVVCLMSGNITERGEVAVLNKYQRASLAINAGASMVFELPILYSLSSAKFFAMGSIKCLSKLNTISHLAFGIETEPEILNSVLDFYLTHEEEIVGKIKLKVKVGQTYSTSLYDVLKELYNNDAQIDSFFAGPNNILALEYMLAIKKLKSNIQPVFIKRTDKGYNSVQALDNNSISYGSASLVRKALDENDLELAKKLVPPYTFELIKNAILDKSKLDALLINELRKQTKKELASFYDYNASIASVINKNCQKCNTLSEIAENSASKSLRKARIKRLLFMPYLGLTKEKAKLLQNLNCINLLAVNRSKRDLLQAAKKQSKLKIFSSLADKNELSAQEKEFIEINKKSSRLQSIVSLCPEPKDLTIFI